MIWWIGIQNQHVIYRMSSTLICVWMYIITNQGVWALLCNTNLLDTIPFHLMMQWQAVCHCHSRHTRDTQTPLWVIWWRQWQSMHHCPVIKLGVQMTYHPLLSTVIHVCVKITSHTIGFLLSAHTAEITRTNTREASEHSSRTQQRCRLWNVLSERNLSVELLLSACCLSNST